MFIHIDTENGLSASEGLNFGDSIRMLCTAALYVMDCIDQQAKETAQDSGEYEKVHGAIYDTFNEMAGAVLDSFDGERSPHTDLTAQAIMEAENAILDREVPDGESDSEETIETNEETDSPA